MSTKLNWCNYTDKFTTHPIYLRVYHMVVPTPLDSILEIGVDCGAGYLLWRELFGAKHITGIDNRTIEECCKYKSREMIVPILPEGDIFIHSPFQSVDAKRLRQFDMIIDDASHWLNHQCAAFNQFLPNLRKGGVYVIEDILHNPSEIINGTKGSPSQWVIFDMKPQTGRPDGLIMAYFNDEGMDTPWNARVFQPS